MMSSTSPDDDSAASPSMKLAYRLTATLMCFLRPLGNVARFYSRKVG
jgi:hypothetical protein